MYPSASHGLSFLVVQAPAARRVALSEQRQPSSQTEFPPCFDVPLATRQCCVIGTLNPVDGPSRKSSSGSGKILCGRIVHPPQGVRWEVSQLFVRAFFALQLARTAPAKMTIHPSNGVANGAPIARAYPVVAPCGSRSPSSICRRGSARRLSGPCTLVERRSWRYSFLRLGCRTRGNKLRLVVGARIHLGLPRRARGGCAAVCGPASRVDGSRVD
jgi:hypothetical protein